MGDHLLIHSSSHLFDLIWMVKFLPFFQYCHHQSVKKKKKSSRHAPRAIPKRSGMLSHVTTAQFHSDGLSQMPLMMTAHLDEVNIG